MQVGPAMEQHPEGTGGRIDESTNLNGDLQPIETTMSAASESRVRTHVCTS
jgi:hypothetical protein